MVPTVYHPNYVTPLPEGHRFPMPKFGMLRDHLLREGIVGENAMFAPEDKADALLPLAHDAQYIEAFCSGRLPEKNAREIGLPWSEGLVRRTRIAVCGTVLTVDLALEHGLACNTAGGTHHAFRHRGAGFCIFNDLAVAAMHALRLGKRVLVLDLDVHQGDGTAAILKDEPNAFTCSLHSGRNFPFRKEQSDLDVALPDGLGDEGYLGALEHTLAHLDFAPDLVLYDAGVDVHEHDKLGRLALTSAGLYARDRFVLAYFRRKGVPVATVIGGGYDKDLGALVGRHAIVHRAARDVKHALG